MLAKHLPPPPTWGSRELQAQATRIDQLARDGETCLAFVGSSTVGSAVDPEILTAQLGHDYWYVAWVSGANAPLLRPWTEEVVVPKLDPEVVVLGVTSMEVNDAYDPANLKDSYYESRGRREAIGSPRFADRASRTGENFSALIALRQYLRSPGELVARLTGRIPEMAPKHGESDHARDKRYGQEPEGMTRVRGYVRVFSIGGDAIEALELSVDQLQADGRAVALLDLPVLEDAWAAWHEGGWSDVEAYRGALHALALRQGIPLFAYHGAFQDQELYRDPIHLNGEGSALFTQRFGRDLRRWLDASAGRCSPIGKGEQ